MHDCINSGKNDKIKVVMAKDLLTDHILGVIPNNFSSDEMNKYVAELEKHYGFDCAVFDA